MLLITSLNSGSNGNCYYVGNENEAILVDAGISCRETEKRLKRLGLSINKVKAIFISHEHADHIRGVPQIAKKHQLPIYITSTTLRNCKFWLQKEVIRTFKADEPVTIGNLKITAFTKIHDASEPHSFVVCYDNVRVGVFTDIGAPCENLTYHFSQCHAAFLESNYDEQMLENGRYPFYLKNRIRGGQGHLSNVQALNFFNACRSPFMNTLILSHLSQENNCPKLVNDLFQPHAHGVEIVVASRKEETAIYRIKAREGEERINTLVYRNAAPVQTSLF